MCTVTIVPTFGPTSAPNGIRVACNRDESRSRPIALPPIQKMFGQRRAVMPIDSLSGGTWIAVNDTGLIMTLLNMNPRDMRGVTFPGKVSRGGIVPSLLHAESLTEACDAARALDTSAYPPFRLVIADTTGYAEVTGGDGGLAVRRQPINRPVMFTSSGLGDALVAEPRHELFDRWFGSDRSAWAQRQEAFHLHRWDDRPELSVDMSREDALTVSLTVIELSEESTTLVYHPAPPSVIAQDAVSPLSLARVSRS
jgi:transport and Golgi organization protein 2